MNSKAYQRMTWNLFLPSLPLPDCDAFMQWLYDVGKAHEINDNVLVREESVRPLSI